LYITEIRKKHTWPQITISGKFKISKCTELCANDMLCEVAIFCPPVNIVGSATERTHDAVKLVRVLVLTQC
jgi:hypothetical protein